ncbi:MAG: hypothetical protein KDC44_16450, partial [Phaeodactylibacter sp.]|nr:hypothetical protein [Phaeodactylibacter sp.]
ILIEKTTVRSFGEVDPSHSNADEEGRSMNRRVDVLVEGLYLESMSDLWSKISDYEDQNYRIDGSRHTKLVGDQGTTVWIDAGAFLLPDGRTADGEIEVVLRETYQLADILAAGLSTHSSGQVLETGGMVYLDARSNGQPLQLKPGTELMVGLPADFQKEGMELFYGEQNDPANAGQVTNWAPTRQPFFDDYEALMAFPDKPKYPYFSFAEPVYKRNDSDYPKAPKRPVEPLEPKLQNSGSYKPGFFKRLFTGKKQIEKKNDEMATRAVSTYNRRMARYQVEMENHEKELTQYEQRVEDHQLAVEAWNAKKAEEAAAYRPGGAVYEAAMAEQKLYYKKKQEAYEKRLELWKEARAKRLEEFEQKYDLAGNLSSEMVSGYFTRINTMGWINCDRFYNVPAEDKMPLAIRDADGSTEATVYVVFKNMESMMQAYKSDGSYIVNNLPRNEAVTVIGIKVEGGRPQMALVDTEVGNGTLTLDYKPCSLSDLRSTLERIN